MDKNKTHRDLDVWKVSMDLVIDLYRVTETFPGNEKYCLVTQIRRAGVSICSNIAEGAGRFHAKEFSQFMYVSLGSVSEVETQMEIAQRLGYIDSMEKQKEMLDRIRKLLIGLINRVKTDS